MRRAVALLICVPLALLGVLVAHQAGYVLAADGDPAQLLADTGHGYMHHMTTAVSLACGLLFVGALLNVVGAWRGGIRAAVATWPFALMGPAAFTVQEHVERLLHDGTVPWTAALEPTFALGLVLQIPVALLAWLAAHLILRVTRIVAGALSRAWAEYLPGASSPSRPRRLRLAVPFRRGPALLSVGAGRAPPRLSHR